MQNQEFFNFRNFILVLVLVFVIYVVFYKSNNFYKKNTINDKLSPDYHYQIIPQDKFPDGFSENLFVRDVSRVWQRGEDTVTPNGKRIKIVEILYPKKEPAGMVVDFERNFKKDGWVIDEKQNKDNPTVRVFDKKYETGIMTIIKINQVDSLVNITIATK